MRAHRAARGADVVLELDGDRERREGMVDLPLAGIMLVLRPLVGGIMAERVAVSVAPLLPLLLLLFSLALAARRLIDPRAFPLVFVTLFFAGSNSNGFARRGILRFDLSTIPPGSFVCSVSLQVSGRPTAAEWPSP